MNSRVAVGRKGKLSSQSYNQGQAPGKGVGQGEKPEEEAAQQLELNDFSRKGNEPKDAKEPGYQNYQRLGGRRDGEPLGDFDDGARDQQKDQLRRYGERLGAQTKQQQSLEDSVRQQAGQQSGGLGGGGGRPGTSSGSGAMQPGGGPNSFGFFQREAGGSPAPMAGEGAARMPSPNIAGMPGMPGMAGPQPSAGGAAGMMGGMGPPGTAATQGHMVPLGQEMAGVPWDRLNTTVSAEPTGFASLDVELLSNAGQYLEFNFSTLGKDLSITSRPASTFLASRLAGIGWLVVIVALAWVLTRRAVRNGLLVLARSPFVGLALITLGVAALVTNVLPMAGLIAGLAGIVQLTWWLVGRGTTAVRPAM